MKSNQSEFNRIYISPVAESMEVVPEAVLCTSQNGQITGSTGATWGEGPDAEW